MECSTVVSREAKRDWKIQGFQEYVEENAETWIACDAEDCEFQMLNDDESVTSVQEESNPVADEADEDEGSNNNESSKGPTNVDTFSALEAVWSASNNNQSAVLLNYCCCSRESSVSLQRKAKVYNGITINKGIFSTIKIHDMAVVAEWYRYRIVACLVTTLNPVPQKTRRVCQRCTLNLLRAETSSRWCGVVVRRGV
ncbi:uncharacterized protein TNCV_3507451 [Trichonephila clavipes]|uniref:Uncharacterized protein n=1 Tax=Trichonephila clavipes TaxID=2585209 RepID=A0A8X6S1I9_TRICX|nr:uncharacterized protein TNCV_3507451 [Trichonephila clavipes]